MSKFLFDEFETVNASAWKQKIQGDLKGADYNETLLWHTNEGIVVKPFYHNDGTPNHLKINSNSWLICQQIEVENANEANQKAIEALQKGSELILFILDGDI